MLYEMKRGRAGFMTFSELSDDYVMYNLPAWTLEECEGNPYNFRSNSYVSE